jgi:hypothetical protein
MRLKAIICQVLSREFEQAIARSPHSIELEILPMGLHDYGVAMRPRIQQQIDASDASGFDAILLGYALCGRGTDGLTAGITPLVLPRAHDCIGILMGGRRTHERYFENHPGVYYRSPGWIEFQKSARNLEPAWAVARNSMGERRSREELIQQYGEENGAFLYEQFTAYRRAYSGLTYISTGVPSDAVCREQARAEAAANHWVFEDVQGSTCLIENLVNGEWPLDDFLVVPSGSSIRATLDERVVVAT